MKLKPGLGASYTIRPGNGVDLFYSPDTHGKVVNYIEPFRYLTVYRCWG